MISSMVRVAPGAPARLARALRAQATDGRIVLSEHEGVVFDLTPAAAEDLHEALDQALEELEEHEAEEAA